MNNYYTLQLVCESLDRRFSGWVLMNAITHRKNLLEFRFASKSDSVVWTLSFLPHAAALFSGPYFAPPHSNALRFFEVLEGRVLRSVRIAEADRFIRLDFGDGDEILIQAYGARGNVFHALNGMVLESFRRHSDWQGLAAPQPSPAASERVLLPKGLPAAASDQIRTDPQPAWVAGYGFTLASEAYLPGERTRRYADVDEGVRDAFRRIRNESRLESRRGGLKALLMRKRDGLRVVEAQLSDERIRAERAAQYEQFGRLLMANAYRDTPDPGADRIRLADWTRDGAETEVVIRPGSTLAESARWYFQRAKEAKESARRAVDRLEEVRRLGLAFDRALDQLEHLTRAHELDPWLNAHAEVLRRSGMGPDGDEPSRTPYRAYRIGGYEVWVGRNAQSNDELLRLARKDDMWMHARGTPGSHVVVRCPKRAESPPGSVLEAAASLAAWHSKQKGSSLVPVILARRKHVRKPKGAPAGAVLVDKEDVLLVKPSLPTE
jgi:predicted ribosome quality control (RQC) complex YloA/Tae2 family protein